MNTSNLELCKELYELSGWIDTKFSWFEGVNGWRFDYEETEQGMYKGEEKGSWLPAYDLSYLLRKLPPVILEDTSSDKNIPMILTLWINGDTTAYIAYLIPFDKENRGAHEKSAKTPEDATAKLTIELFKQGILK